MPETVIHFILQPLTFNVISLRAFLAIVSLSRLFSTDIITYIDKGPIQSANIGGRTMISAEDMKYFGFDVK